MLLLCRQRGHNPFMNRSPFVIAQRTNDPPHNDILASAFYALLLIGSTALLMTNVNQYSKPLLILSTKILIFTLMCSFITYCWSFARAMFCNSIRTCIVKANLTITFCPLVSITARKFNYSNAKSIQDEGEPDRTDWNMTLYSDSD